MKKFEELLKVELPDLLRLGDIWLKDATYYGRAIEVAGKILSFGMEGGKVMLDVKVSGTKDDEFLKEMSGRRDRMARVHLCERFCPEAVTGATLLHARLYKVVEKDKEAWMTNLEGVLPAEAEDDELARLREAAKEANRGETGSPKEKTSKKEKKRKEKEKQDAEDKKKPLKKESSVGRKALAGVFGGTALDPDPLVRAKILKKAKRVGQAKKKKKKKSSGSGGSDEESTSSSSSSTTIALGGGLFESEGTLKAIWKRYPGALTASAISEAREALLTTAGTIWEVDTAQLPPLLTQYGRANALPVMTPAMSQEALTLCMCVDLLLRGEVASCADVLSQRVKCLEAIARGSHWQVGRQLELVRAEPQTITEDSEALAAARRAREEAKLKALTNRAPGSGGGGENTPKGKKGKDAKGQGKNRFDDQGRGKGKGRKDEGQEGQKKWRNEKDLHMVRSD